MIEKFRELVKKKNRIFANLELIQWDLETKTPVKSKPYLAELVGELSMQEYDLFTSEKFENLVETLNKENPKIALLNIGSENGKGTKVLKETYSVLENEDMNFVGNIESRDIFNGDVDVVVCDGFHGNVVLKTIEGSVKFILDNIKKTLMSSILGKIGGLLIKSPMKKLKKTLDYKEYGACPMLGLKKVVFKGHGSSDEKAVVSGIVSMVDYIKKDINLKIEEKIERGEK